MRNLRVFAHISPSPPLMERSYMRISVYGRSSRAHSSEERYRWEPGVHKNAQVTDAAEIAPKRSRNIFREAHSKRSDIVMRSTSATAPARIAVGDARQAHRLHPRHRATVRGRAAAPATGSVFQDDRRRHHAGVFVCSEINPLARLYYLYGEALPAASTNLDDSYPCRPFTILKPRIGREPATGRRHFSNRHFDRPLDGPAGHLRLPPQTEIALRLVHGTLAFRVHLFECINTKRRGGTRIESEIRVRPFHIVCGHARFLS